MVMLSNHVNGHATDRCPSSKVLQLANILGSRALGTLNHIETDTITLGQRFKTFTRYCRMMHKKVLSTVLLNKTKALPVIKPFNFSFRHSVSSFVLVPLWKHVHQFACI